MDNITHSLAGMLLAEAACARRPATGRVYRVAAYATSIAANNLPDLDFVVTPLTGGQIGYLLHHRGHTHTLAFAIVAGALACLLWAFFGKQSRREELFHGWRSLAVLAVIGLFLHILLDFTNNYGVHPFWPLDDRWFYGDSIFIIEPFLWAASIPALLFSLHSRAAKIGAATFLGVGVVAAWAIPLVRVPAAAAFTIAVVLALLLHRRRSRPARVHLALASWVGVTLAFAVASTAVRSGARRAFAEMVPGRVVLDIVVTPLPSDPICWDLVIVSTRGSEYSLHTASASLLPAMTPASSCVPRAFDELRTAPLVPVPPGTRRDLSLRGELKLEAAELRAVAADCRAAAALRFMRAPFLGRAGGHLVLGDLRYDFEPELGFAEVPLPEGDAACPQFVPPWTPPRADLLEELQLE